MKLLFKALLTALAFSSVSLALADTETPPPKQTDTADSIFDTSFAEVNGEKLPAIMLKEFIQQRVRHKFYHGTPPEGEEKKFHREMADLLVLNHLLFAKATDNGIQPDQAQIDKLVSEYDNKFANSPEWQQVRSEFLPLYRRLLELTDVAAKYEKQVRSSVEVTEEDVKAFYANNRDKFTQPPQNRVAVIMLNVAPSAGGFVWKATQEQANVIYEKLEQGADFAELAELHSTDATADNGGDMGFLHQGMTSEKVENTLADMEIGEFTKPLVLLDGVALFKLLERKPAIAHTFEEVKRRATALASAYLVDMRWEQEKQSLLDKAEITLNPIFFE